MELAHLHRNCNRGGSTSRATARTVEDRDEDKRKDAAIGPRFASEVLLVSDVDPVRRTQISTAL